MRNITYTNYRQIPFWVVLIPDDLGSGPLLSGAIIDHERTFAGPAGRPHPARPAGGLRRGLSGPPAAPVTGLTVSGWTVTPGGPVSGAQPPDRIVRFYVAGRVKPKLLCLVDVRYFPQGSAWVPYYRMDERMYFTRRGHQWVPLTFLNGVPALVTATPLGFANAAGYYRGFSFSRTTGPITLAGWTVVRDDASPLPAP